MGEETTELEQSEYVDTSDYYRNNEGEINHVDTGNSNYKGNDNEFDIDDDNDVDYSKIDATTNKKISEKKKVNAELNNLSKISDIDVEKAILYLLITSYNNDILKTISDFKIKQEYFISDIGNKLFDIIYSLGTTGKLDYLLVKEKFENLAKDDKEKATLKPFFNFSGFIPKKELFLDYLDLLTSNFSRNGLNNLLLNLEKAIKEKSDDKIKYFKHEIEGFELKASADDNPDLGLVTNDYLSKQAIDWVNGRRKTSNQVLKTGFALFDNRIGGFEKGQFIIFAARPSVGKSISLINTMYSMCNLGYNCLYVSAEMYAKYVYSRWVSIDLEINNNKIKAPFKLSESEKKKVMKFHEKFKDVKNARFFFDNVVTSRDIEVIARQVKAQNGGKLDAIFVDYLGKLYPNNLDMKRSKNEIISDIADEMFHLAGKLDVAIITASQLSRASSKDADQASLVAPKLSDLKDSGQLEANADFVIGLTRDVIAGTECFTEEQKTDFNRHVIKNRTGELGIFTFDFHPTIQKLVDQSTLFKEKEKTPEGLAKKTDNQKQANLIKDILKEEEGDNFSIGNADIFGK